MIKYALSKKQNRIEISPERKEFKAKRRKRKEKQRKEKKRKKEEKKTGVQGVSPFALQIQTFQKKERIKDLQ